MAKKLIGAVGIVVVGLGLVGGAFVGPYGTYQEVQSHETTEATVTSAGMTSAEEVEDGETEVEYYPRIEYEYGVDGERYTDDRVWHPSQVGNEEGELRGKEFDSRQDAREVVSRYDEGSTVTVRYDPDDPGTSYLEDPSTDLLMATGIMSLMGLVFGGVGVVSVGKNALGMGE